MKKIFESKLYGYGEFAERIHVYQLDEDEFWKFYSMQHDDMCKEFDVFDESDYEVTPGAVYHTYKFYLHNEHIIMIETVALNV